MDHEDESRRRPSLNQRTDLISETAGLFLGSPIARDRDRGAATWVVGRGWGGLESGHECG